MGTESHKRPRIVRFGTFEADLATRELRKSGVRIKLHGQPVEVLAMLLERPGEAVQREELRKRLWSSDTFVDFDAGVNTAINRLREALNDSAENPRFIETLPRRGYRFIAPVEAESSDQPLAHGISPKPSLSKAETEAPVTPHTHPKRTKALAIGLATVVALLIVLSWTGVHKRLLGHDSLPHVSSLAVLPLANLSGDPEQEYFCDGLTETLTNDLGRLRALRVISRTSAMHYKGSKKTVPEIARDLNVDALIEGTVLRSANHARITVNLIQASPEMHLWAENYETEVGDLLGVQEKVAQSVAREIQIALEPPSESPPNRRGVNAAAQDLYFRGLFAIRSGTAESAENAIRYFQRSIQEDPAYAPAYAAIAEVYAVWYPGKSGPRETMPKAQEAARKALALDETLPAAHSVLGNVELWYDWNWVDAEKEFRRALELDPNYVLAHNSYARELVILGRNEEALAQAKQAMGLDPYAEGGEGDYPIWVTYLAHQYDEAERVAKAKIALDPNYPWAHYDLALTYEQMGKSTESVEEYLRFEGLSGADPQRLARLQEAFRTSGVKGFWRERLRDYRKAAKRGYVSAGMVAEACARVGDKDCVFEWLEKAFEERDDLMINLNVDPVFNGIRAHPRFQDLVHRVGLPKPWPS